MSFTLKEVVPWGRSFDEYGAMFSLSETDLSKTILGCGDGPASFNAELTAKGGEVVSVDPMYQFSQSEIELRIGETCNVVMEQIQENQNEFVWRYIKSCDELRDVRMSAMRRFLEDYSIGGDRYLSAELPLLPFDDNQFDLALCSHFLFLYSQQFSLDLHLHSVTELCRVASEVRIFPLLELGSKKSRHFSPVIEMLKSKQFSWHIEQVDYEFQKGGNQMLVIKPLEMVTPRLDGVGES